MNINHIPLPARRLSAAMVAAVLIPAGLAACSDGGSSTSGTPEAATSTKAASTMATSVTPSDTWVKAADTGMSAAFGTLENSGTKPVVITGVSGDAGPAQLHTMVKTASGMEMQQTDKFTLPAGGALKLAPGGNHIMLMGLTKPLKTGDTQRLTLSFADGSRTTVTFPVRAYDGAKETYSGSTATSSDHSMSSHSMPSHSMGTSSGTASAPAMNHSH